VRHRLLLIAVYAGASFLVVAYWTCFARTEYVVSPPEGGPPAPRFSNIVRLADGSVGVPFSRRRLLPDAARALSKVTPPGVWAAFDRQVRGDGPLSPTLRRVMARVKWPPEHYPLLLSAFAVMWASALGFMLTCRWLVTYFYRCPVWLADAAGLLFGVALLGGNGDWHYCGYAYDFPQAFVFALTLAGILARRPWFLLAFALAAYSKETSVLLIAAYALLRWDRRSAQFWLTSGAMVAVFAALRLSIHQRFPAGPGPDVFWLPVRNLKYLAVHVIGSAWSWPFLAVGMARFLGRWRHYPAELRRLSLLAVPMLGIAFFKGWFEELRQYLELLPIFGLMVMQWLLREAGYGRFAEPCSEAAAPAAPGESVERPTLLAA
jgi:hypothetical protein